jgi:hypothetical protein
MKFLFSTTKIFIKIIYFLHNLGLIDSHTHPIWQGDRINEFKMKVGVNFIKIKQLFHIAVFILINKTVNLNKFLY